MRLLILGGDGMLGHKLYQTLGPRFETFATVRAAASAAERLPVYVATAGRGLIGGVDAVNFSSVITAFGTARPDVVVNCIGIVKQRQESHDPVLALTVNSLLPHRLADLCAATGARLVHISTDCVFSGDRGGYRESDPADAQDLYGRSKLMGEVTRPGCVTLRTSIIGRDFRNHTGLLEWFLAQRGTTIQGYRRMVFSGFPTQIFSDIIGTVIERHPNLEGLYHVASAPITKCDLLQKLQSALAVDVRIEPTEGPICDRSLDGSRFIGMTGVTIPTWDELIDAVATDSTPYGDWRVDRATA
jgi:dTDP-4-dehydrorhamnose reductase